MSVNAESGDAWTNKWNDSKRPKVAVLSTAIAASHVLTPARTPESEHNSDTMSFTLAETGTECTTVSDRLAESLTLEEQVSLLAGADFWRTVALSERGIPSIKTTDGPNGARGEFFKNGTPAALFPCGVSLAATWNVDLIEKIGEHLGDETKARGAQVLLAPTVCMHRGPLGGRNFESFSEDPFLTGKLAASYIRGLQSKQVSATIKHFVGNEIETNRNDIDTIVAERPLREIYLKPFEIAVREANPWAVMSSYNLVNGIHADMHEHTLKDILRGEWGFDGLVMSDWMGTNSTSESIAAGCDLEMPGPARKRGARALRAVQNGLLSQKDVTRAASNVIRLVERTKGLGGEVVPEPAETTNDTPDLRRLIRQAGVEGLTLLKNERDLLPIAPNTKKIALIGPNVKRAIAGGGGSASLNPYYLTTPFEGISAHTSAEILYAEGCKISKWLPLINDYCTLPDGTPGVLLEYYHGHAFSGLPVEVQHKLSTDLYLWDSAPKTVLPDYSFRVHTTVTPKTTGLHTFSFQTVGPGRLLLNGELFIDNWNWTEPGEAMFSDSIAVLKSVHLTANQPISLLVESTNELRPLSAPGAQEPTHYGGCRIGYKEEVKTDLLAEAVLAAESADIAILIVGLDAEWESEGYDRQTMALPQDGSQDTLISAVAAANPNTIVVNQSGTPVAMPWVSQVPAILQAWYQGQEAGNALAEVLFGLSSPSGKLPTTFPVRLEDNPSFNNWPGENLKVVYGEGIFVGYRHYDRAKLEPLFAFGYGLSYTTFAYGEATIDTSVLTKEGKIEVVVPVTNTGGREGLEIVQAYVKDVKCRLPRPEKELQAFGKVQLKPGETRGVKLCLDKYSVGYFDTSLREGKGEWVAEKGEFEVWIGASSRDIRQVVRFEVEETFTWIF